MPFLWVLLAMRWALSSSMAIWDTANFRMAFTRMATSNIWAAIRCPCLVPSSRVSSTRMLMYLQKGMDGYQRTILHYLCDELQAGSWKHWPFKVCDVLIIGLAADVYDFGQQLISVRRPFGFIHVNHQFLHNLHQVLLGDLLKKWWRVQPLSYTAKSSHFQSSSCWLFAGSIC